MGKDLAALDAYFSCIVVAQLPNIKTIGVAPEGRMLIGSELFAEQVSKLRTLLASLLNSRLVERDARAAGAGGPGRRIITSRQGLWYAMLPRIVERLNSGEAVHVSRLVDEAWTACLTSALGSQAPMDVYKALVTALRPGSQLSAAAPRLAEDVLMRFDAFSRLACDVAVRIVVGRLRALDASLLFDDKVEIAARPQLETVLRLLDDIAPCRAVYGEGGRAAECGRPLERPDEPVLCLQECRVHAKGHRGSRRVKGGGSTLWQRLLAVVPYNPTWPGAFVPPHVTRPDVRTMLSDVVEGVHAPRDVYLTSLADLQHAYTSASCAVEYVVMDGAAPVAPPACLLRLRPRRTGEWVLPYCVACARPCPLDDAAVAAAAAASRGSPSLVDSSSAAGMAPSVSPSSTSDGPPVPSFTTWAQAVFHELLSWGGGASSSSSSSVSGGKAVSFGGDAASDGVARQRSNTGSGGGVGGLRRSASAGEGGVVHGSPFSAAAVAGPSTGSGAVEQQLVTLGLCGACTTDVVIAVTAAATAAAAVAVMEADEGVEDGVRAGGAPALSAEGR